MLGRRRAPKIVEKLHTSPRPFHFTDDAAPRKKAMSSKKKKKQHGEEEEAPVSRKRRDRTRRRVAARVTKNVGCVRRWARHDGSTHHWLSHLCTAGLKRLHEPSPNLRRERKMDPGSLKTPRERSAATAARAPSSNCAVYIPLKRRLFSLLSPLKGCFPSSSLPPSVPSSPFFLPPSSLFPSRRFIFGGRVLDINCPASSQQTHCTTCPNSISNYYSTVDKRDAGKYLLLRGELLMGRKLIKG